MKEETALWPKSGGTGQEGINNRADVQQEPLETLVLWQAAGG